MNRDSNKHTYIFAILMVVSVAFVLSFTSESLKDLQNSNVKKEKMQNILSSVGINVSRDESEDLYMDYISEELSLKLDGTIDSDIEAFDINLALEVKKDSDTQRFPLYIANVENEKFYVIPLRGAGLWAEIWGYIALREDINTIKGVSFDHKSETAGLGAEITEDWFIDSFTDEKINDSQGNFVGVYLTKSNNDPRNEDKMDNEVDAISGATITGDGVSDMIIERVQNYLPYFNNISNE
ncbi:MAG: NADH:ubiquinone reductase (Na(+)-transporting) subunit C [Cryomorphaceae bacterium MED-G11]|jgi:Na+-transporting NADH:ubiquinone oxidoreductase subunit C|nr:NADH:ubiquinone reductase (Na(+)-transporting) subunit C [Flavobacteriaceae bacterium]MDC0034216.1 NADH:ubiquinone reductase (Na(+)-transporting) subunit C [Flavobacteriaceae bacterium]MDC0162915.1 NADH:ubiquinone reductase (Na(+)-transporting) subunit C [Flavobacteriaceae bacterium]PDH54330.1 MAG: NADH:ubiquinone reductase (Na(+)-transporting) subunit C [Cryomorphaceae bacterium MED-G11]|tara:strand:- start:4858 stop:5574 length:717 start_codon:yes stop_codon:yes gene_type:complete